MFISFGRKCDSRFFVNYGCIVENNPANEALMRFELHKNDPEYSKKAEYLGLFVKIFKFQNNIKKKR